MSTVKARNTATGHLVTEVSTQPEAATRRAGHGMSGGLRSPGTVVRGFRGLLLVATQVVRAVAGMPVGHDILLS